MKNYIIKLFCLVFASCLLCSLSSCEKPGPYEFWQPDDQIESIEIVNVYGKISEPLQYDVLVTITDHESFLEKFYEIPFGKELGSVPNRVHGPCIRVVYKNGDSEYINDFYQSRYLNGANDFYDAGQSCDQEEFFALLTYFGYVG